jgi:LPXTG-site transpeptidase (sortase) family protein
MKHWNVTYDSCLLHPDCLDHGVYRVVSHGHTSIWEKLRASYTLSLQQVLGLMFLALGLGGVIGPMVPTVYLEAQYAISQAVQRFGGKPASQPQPEAAVAALEPITTPDGSTIEPISQDFALIVPKIGINALVIPGVDPLKPAEYQEALKTGVAHASTSFLPDEDGTVYLFSHSTNYDWFVHDLNAVFYLLKNLETDDSILIIYRGKRYTYKITGKKVVSPRDITYLYPYVGQKNLVLQTCWPPGSTAERLLIFADLVETEAK